MSEATEEKTILLVEDEACVRDITARMLRRFGYRVIEAASPSEALEVFSEAGAAPDLALIDLTLPEMDGRKLLSELRRAVPELCAIFVSGYSIEGLDLDNEPGFTGFLQKPYPMSSLKVALSAAEEYSGLMKSVVRECGAPGEMKALPKAA